MFYKKINNKYYKGKIINLPSGIILNEDNKENDDGWEWFDEPPIQYIDWKYTGIDGYGYNLRIHQMVNDFNIYVDSISNVAFESGKIYNEFNGLKEKTTYVNENDEIVAVKNFELYKEGNKKGSKLVIDFYNIEDEIVEEVRVSTIDFFTDLQIHKHRKKCVLRVFERVLWDFEQEVNSLNFIKENYSEEQKQLVAQQLGLNNIIELTFLTSSLNDLYNDLLKIKLKDEVDLMYKTGETEELFNKLSVIEYPFLDQQAITSEQEIKLTFRQILMAKFNPNNFKFYEDL